MDGKGKRRRRICQKEGEQICLIIGGRARSSSILLNESNKKKEIIICIFSHSYNNERKYASKQERLEYTERLKENTYIYKRRRFNGQ